ncbi:uncharacterized protein LOC100370623 [Saccoglossus kowalevskii]|uniref:Uncharacterized protein LOC100370623 n=1 Tax=Saccoglossus kowalevskii TaxID=10224 RepID=A0ABM0GY45_SACKO|nr:PREDICTED: uncharacterized protein LOC100370623 [Saccoglossus kowalevskii]
MERNGVLGWNVNSEVVIADRPFPWLEHMKAERYCYAPRKGLLRNKKWDYKVDKEFIRRWEGFTTEGHVPDDDGIIPGGHGVVIGYGVDLGTFTNTTYFKHLGLTKDVIERLELYVGLRGDKAKEVLQSNPLTLSSEDAAELSERVMERKISEIAEIYDGYIDDKGNRNFQTFDQLTLAQKTVIASIFYQYGATRKIPTLWKQLTNQWWKNAATNLRNFDDKFPERRKAEAELLTSDDGALSLH